jgi:hypothetical protein
VTNTAQDTRPDAIYTTKTEEFGVVEKPLSLVERLWGSQALRKAVLLILMAVLWEVYARTLGNALVFPTFRPAQAPDVVPARRLVPEPLVHLLEGARIVGASNGMRITVHGRRVARPIRSVKGIPTSFEM